jgi:hypothetical protein
MEPNFFVVVIVLITVGGSLAFALTIVLSTLAHRRRKLELIHQERMAAIEKGLPIPTDFGDIQYKKRPYVGGMTWIAVGIGIIIFGLTQQQEDHDLIGLGTIPLLVGVALIVGDLIAARKAKSLSNGGATYPEVGALNPHRENQS